VIRKELARLKLSIITSSSMRCSFTGGLVGWTMNTSRPRTSSSILQEISPSGNRPSEILPIGRLR
jgi:hypothetical protein